jgi:hypothetical protein
MRSHHFAIAAATVLLVSSPGPAWSGVVIDTLQPKNQNQICRFENGTYRVDPVRLARSIVAAAAIAPDLIDSRDRPDDVISLLVKDQPFGTGSAAVTPLALAARERLLAARMELTGFLVLGDADLARLDGYSVVNAQGRRPTSDDLFLRPDLIYIRCDRLGPQQQQAFVSPHGPGSTAERSPAAAKPWALAPASSVPAVAKQSPASWARRLLVRGDILELLIPEIERGRSKGATFSFAHDDVDNEDTFLGDGTLGWDLWRYEPQRYPTAFPYLQNAKIVPYFKYDSTGKQSTELPEYIEPGVMINAYLHKQGSFAANAGLTASRIIDDNDGSDQSSLSAYIIPSFALPVGPSPLFGGYIRLFGPMIVRPELQLLASGRQIEDAGTNPALQGEDSYIGIGFNQRIDVMFTGLPVLQDLRGYLEYRLMHNFGVRDADMFQAGLYYPLLDELLSLNFDYSDGRDLATLLEDTRYMLGLAFRY